VKIVKIYGGLGNQMFQYAFARSLAARTGDQVFIDRSGLEDDRVHNGFELEGVFGIGLPEARPEDARRLSSQPTGLIGRFRRKYLTKRSHVIDRKFGFQPELFELEGDRYFEGYWQSEKFFEPIAELVREDYRFRRELSDRNLALLRDLPRPIASVHVRRGDYLKYPNLNICTPDYYLRGIEAMRADGGTASFMVFSDDIGYCRSTLGLAEDEAAFVDWNTGEESWQDMAMMARCDRHIIANSSFSWWGAWLDPLPGKRVIAPSVWNRREIDCKDRYYSFSFGDIVPPSWERVAL
jgi:hypothetical protein